MCFAILINSLAKNGLCKHYSAVEVFQKPQYLYYSFGNSLTKCLHFCPFGNLQTKKDEFLEPKLERVPFLEEQVRKIRDGGKVLTMDIHRLLLSEDNRFEFVNEVAAEAKMYVENNRDEYGAKKAILHVLSNRMNDAGTSRPEAYLESDPFNPGPGYLREEL